MNHALGMSGIECCAQLPGDLKRPLEREWPFFFQQLTQVPAFDKGHGDVLHTIDLAEVVDAQDVSVGNLAGEKQFLLEALGQKVIGDQFWLRGLEFHLARQLLVEGFVDLAHSARAQQLLDSEPRTEVHPRFETPRTIQPAARPTPGGRPGACSCRWSVTSSYERARIRAVHRAIIYRNRSGRCLVHCRHIWSIPSPGSCGGSYTVYLSVVLVIRLRGRPAA